MAIVWVQSTPGAALSAKEARLRQLLLQGLQSGGMPQDLWLWKFGMELGGEGFEMIVHDG